MNVKNNPSNLRNLYRLRYDVENEFQVLQVLNFLRS